MKTENVHIKNVRKETTMVQCCHIVGSDPSGWFDFFTKEMAIAGLQSLSLICKQGGVCMLNYISNEPKLRNNISWSCMCTVEVIHRIS